MPYYTGTKTVLTLRKYIDGQPTDETKANSISDPDYIPPFQDTADCPIEAYTTTTTSTTTTTTTTAAPSSSLLMWRSTTGGGNNPPTGWSTESLACSSAANSTTVFFTQNVTGWDDVVNNSLVVYQDSGATVPYQGQNTFFRTAQTAGTGKTFQMDNSGVISNYVVCTTTTTSTTTTTTTAAASCYNYEVSNSGSDTVVFSYTACNGSSASVTIPQGFSSQTICAQINTVTMSPNTGTIGSPTTVCT